MVKLPDVTPTDLARILAALSARADAADAAGLAGFADDYRQLAARLTPGSTPPAPEPFTDPPEVTAFLQYPTTNTDTDTEPPRRPQWT